ncbi:hypothetical protein GXP67_27965 [Rhodocytophaga rosea]|uniref:Uncharacterized protein n=1 Tax=Rhodocytophaga rosea TaxID=2704465 RepID=A0A6C0GQ72_9BACT|nr:hypothetical protein [Rhodocytophaga rosea]QHT70209.1 hypothetical protein GXP67_27965 [Rhodocytophaga rosea]
MKKNYTILSYVLIVSLFSIFLLPSCQTSRLQTAADAGLAIQTETKLAQAQMTATTEEPIPQEPSLMQISVETNDSEDMPAGASTQADLSTIDLTTLAHPAELVRAPVAKTTMPVAQEKTSSARQIQKKLSLPARMMMKSIVKKAEKLQKKDITGTTQEQEINNNRYLVAGIILLLAGLVLVLVGNTTLLYVLGSVASLAGLIFLLLAIL